MELSKYQQTALRILAIPEGVYEVDMSAFSKEYGDPKHSIKCGTTYCIAGILAHEDRYPERYNYKLQGVEVFSYANYSEELTGFLDSSVEWNFLFDIPHPDTLESAKARAMYVLTHDHIPPEGVYSGVCGELTLSKYQQTALRILNIPEGKYDIDMKWFCSMPDPIQYSHKCGTTYCIAGILAHEDGYPKEHIVNRGFMYSTYSSSLIGYNMSSDYWEYLFSSDHPDSLESAKERALYALINDSYEVSNESSK